MIRVEIDILNAPEWAKTDEHRNFAAYVCAKLGEAGVPLIGGPISVDVDLSKGKLTTWDEHDTGKKIYIWEPSECQ